MTAQNAVSRDDTSVGPRAACRTAVMEAIGSVRGDGIDPGPVGLAALDRIARGEADYGTALAEVLAHYRRR